MLQLQGSSFCSNQHLDKVFVFRLGSYKFKGMKVSKEMVQLLQVCTKFRTKLVYPGSVYHTKIDLRLRKGIQQRGDGKGLTLVDCTKAAS